MVSRDRLEEWKQFYEKATSRVKTAYMPESWRYPYFSVNIRELNLGGAKDLEWILTNGIGGYSSSTILGLNTRRCHGLLASSSRNLRRKMLLSNVDEEISFGDSTIKLWLHEHPNGINAPGRDFLGVFKFNLDSVLWIFDLDGVKIEKHLELIPNKNILLLQYEIENKFDSEVKLDVKPLVTSRGIHDLLEKDAGFKCKIFSSRAAGVSSEEGYLLLYSEQMDCLESKDRWLHGIKHSLESEEPQASESLFTPVVFTVTVKPKSKETVSILALGYGSEEEAVQVFKELAGSRGHQRRQKLLSSGIGEDIIAFSAACDSFIVDYLDKKTIIAGYPCLGQKGRDAMISIPGLTLASRRFDLAEKIFENFLNHMHDGRIPSEFRDGTPEYNDFDSTLWLINSLHEYRKCVGDERFKKFLWTYWPELKDVLNFYRKFERKGLLRSESNTWMHPLQRDSAVEVQGLWYNALKIMQNFSFLLQDRIDVSYYIKKFEENFMKNYWNGSYLKDTLDDNSLRPNQLVVISLGHSVVGVPESRSILDLAERELLTQVGLRTLPKDDSKYIGCCSQRDNSYYNGAVWPWLVGPYFRAYMSLNKNEGREKALDFIKQFLNRHMREAGIGTISQVFDGDYPHTPRGCISQAINTAELMKTYSEATKI